MLKLKRFPIDTQREAVAYLSRDCTEYRAEGFRALDRIELKANGHTILATLNIVEGDHLLAPDEIGLSPRAFGWLGCPEGISAAIAQASAPASLEAVRAKIRGRTLADEDYRAIIADVASHRYSKMELAAFLVSTAGFMSTGEVLALTRAMAETGTTLKWDWPLVADKHCIGGIPGNRTTLIVVPIIAAHGLPIPKTSSRAITSPAGTADTMELLARVDLSLDEMRDVVQRHSGCLVWGGHMNLAPADDVLISVERPLAIDTPEQMVASILAKKKAAGSTHLVIDIPIGPSAKVRTPSEAVRLRKLFEHVGDALGLTLDVVVTDGSQPIGRGIGPVLEVRDVLKVLRRDADAPQDLREKSIMLAGRILEFDPAIRGGQGAARARELLDSGAALTKLEAIIAAQGAAETMPHPGRLAAEIPSPRTGRVTAIDCWRISRIASLAGAPMDKAAGLDLLKKVGDETRQGEPLFRLHASFPADFGFAMALAVEDCGYTVA